MSGILDMNNNKIENVGTATNNNDAMGKLQTENAISNSVANYLPLSGGTMAGNINMDGVSYMQNLPTPVLPSDAVTKSYVDNIASNITWKPAC